MPLLKKFLTELFGDGTKIHDEINPNEVVALGATHFASMLLGHSSLSFIIHDDKDYPLGIQISRENGN